MTAHDGAPFKNWKKSSFRRILSEAGLRPTRQRINIAERLFALGDRHFTAENLYQETRADKYPPTLATIYNALHDFAGCGLVREIALYGSKLWYDTKTGPHFHYYDEVRQELFDIPEECLPQLTIPAAAGTRIVGIDVVVRVAPLARDARDTLVD